MKRKWKIWSAFLAMFLLFLSGVIISSAEEMITAQVTGKYGQSEARSMLEMINEFRAGDDAWYWNESDSEKIYNSNLQELKYDYQLERDAMLRAMEIAIFYSHTRPNGDSCFSAVTLGGYRGENIAIGYTSASAVFEGWQETEDDYEGQGHRRNMLSSDFKTIGIGHVYYNGYHCWVQEFSSQSGTMSENIANDSDTTVSIEILPSNIKNKSISLQTESIEFAYGDTVELPNIDAELSLTSTWRGRACPVAFTYQWSDSQNDSCIEIDNSSGTMTAVSVDETVITTEVLDEAFEVKLKVIPKPIDSAENQAIITLEQSEYEYTGYAQTPSLTVTLGGKTLIDGTDYKTDYDSNIDVGEAFVTITGTGNYQGTLTATFKITPKSFSADEFTIEMNDDEFFYTGEAQEPAVTVRWGNAELAKETDYIVEYEDNVDAGEAIVHIVGAGNYSGQLDTVFTINPLPLSDVKIEDIESCVFTGEAIEPEITIHYGKIQLEAGTDYVIVHSDNIDAGNAKVEIKGQGNYIGTLNLGFRILRKTLSNDEFVVDIENVAYTGSVMEPLVSVLWNEVKLAEGADYSVSYKDNMNAGTASVAITGEGNYEGEIAGSFKILPLDLNGEAFSVDGISSYEYTGSAIKPDINILCNGNSLEKDKDYTIEYQDNINAGTATIIIKGTGNYTETRTEEFKITPADLTDYSLPEIEPQTYTGSEIVPDLRLNWRELQLELSEDYTVECENNLNCGIADLVVKGIGNFQGTSSTTFAIVPEDISNCSVTIEPQEYTGIPLRPVVTVIHGTRTLIENEDCSVGYVEETKVGRYTVKIAGIGNYTGETEAVFEITAADLSECTVNEIAEQTYTGSSVTPEIVIMHGTRALIYGTDYETVYENNIEVGTATVAITGKGNYKGNATTSFVIAEAKSDLDSDQGEDQEQNSGTGQSTEQTPSVPTPPKAGTKFTDTKSGATYTVSIAGASGTAAVEYKAPTNKKAAVVNVPNVIVINNVTYKVASIAPNAFKNSKKLKTINIGGNVEVIGANAFSGSSKLTTITIGSKVTAIGAKAFYKCTALNKVTIPAKVTGIGKQAFAGCKKLKSITIKTKKLTDKTVGAKAFKGINSKATIKVPKKVLNSYKKILKKKGIDSKVKIKK